MNPWRTILLRARPSLIALASAILVALALTLGSGYVEGNLRSELQQHRNQTGALRGNLDAKQQDLAYAETHVALFHTLQKQGLMSPPDRENWVDHLLAARKELRLPDTLVYTLPPPVPLKSGGADGAAAASTGGEGEATPDAPLSHDIEISLRDIHEEELLALLKNLQATLAERFRVQYCRLSSPAPSGLAAECTLRFFTLPVAPNAPTGATP